MTARDVQHRISELLDERGWSPTHLAKVVGVPTSTITDIFKRDSYPTLPLIEKIADAFDITVGEFFSFDIPPSPEMPLTPMETRIMAYVKKLNAHNQERVIDFMDGIIGSDDK